MIETRTIDHIPESERHGVPRDLFAVWFGANMNMTTLVTGALLFTLGLNVFWSMIAILVGSAIGAVFVAAHSVQGPRLGIPQMIQSRAQFGIYGAIVPMLFVMFIYFGFSVSNTLIVTQAVSGVIGVSKGTVILAFSFGTFLVALFGYRLIHRTQSLLTWVSIAVFAVVAALIFWRGTDAAIWNPAPPPAQLLLVGVGLTATFTLSCAPYVADYSRYLPSNTSSAAVFWYTYAGMVLAMVVMMTIGALLAAQIPGYLDNSGANLARLFGRYALVLYAVIVYALLCINVFNFYGAFMAVVTTLQPFVSFAVTPIVRAVMLAAIMVGNIAFSVWGEGDFADMFLKFIFIMSYALIPWTAINLVDYYLVRKGKYSIPDIFDPAGIYGRFNGVAIGAFLLSMALEVPFISLPFYVGPIAKALGGMDLAWLVGVVGGASCYYFPMRTRTRRALLATTGVAARP